MKGMVWRKMKKVLFIVLDILTIAFLVGGYVIQYFTKRKLGMMRWVVFKNSKWHEKMPLDVLKYAAVAVVLLLVLMVFRGFLKKRAYMSKNDMVMIFVMAALAAAYLGFTMFVSSDTVRAYYLIMPMIGAAALLQVIRNMVVVWTCRDEK